MFKTIKYILLIGALGMIVCSCDGFFDLKPSNEMVLDDFWRSEDDVLSTTGECYRAMQSGDYMKRMVVWGEFRGDNLVLGSNNDDDNLRYIANLNLLASNEYTKWGSFYTVINLCNTIEAFAPRVREKDPNFTTAKLNAYLAEVKTLKAYSYFTLVRAFRDIPFVKDPVIDDTQSFQKEQYDPDKLIDELIDELKEVENYAVTTYGTTAYNKGRVTQATLRTVLADMLLWRGRYDECIQYCDKVLANNTLGYTLESSYDAARNIFVTGNSDESIFELQFSTVNEWNWAVRDFYAESSMGYGQKMVPYDFIGNNSSLFAETDIRRNTTLYSSSDRGTFVRKYVSYLPNTAFNGSNISYTSYIYSTPQDCNWVIYRLPDIYLMKAEALTELGTDLQTAFNLACLTYDRANPSLGAGSLSFDNYNSQQALLSFIYDERQREFMFEGKRYFDLVRRISHHRDQFRTLVQTYLQPKYADLDQTTVSTKLSSYDGLFMPINSSELRANLLLVQNPFYKLSTDINH